MSKPRTTTGQVFKSLAQGLKTAATRPNVNGYRPHEKQIIFHSSDARGRLFLGGNRSGKTVGGAVEAVWRLTGKHPYLYTPPPPIRGRCVSVDFLNGVEKIVKPEVMRWMPTSELRGGSWSNAYDKEMRTLHLANGSFLEFMSYDQDLDKFAGTSRHFVWFDEEPPRDVFTENRMRLLDVGGQWWITMTPVEGMTWVYDDIYTVAKTDPSFKVVEVDMNDNVYLNQGEIDGFLSGLTADEVKARKQGRFVQIGGLIYKQFGDAHIIDPIAPETLKPWLQVASLDHGYNNPTCWLWAAISPDNRIIVFDEHYESGKIVSYHAQAVHLKNQEHGREPEYYVGDPSIRNTDPITGTSVQLEYIEHGVPVMLGNNDVKAGINRVARYLETIGTGGKPQLLVTRNCVNLIHEMQRLRWSTWATKKMQGEKNPKEEQHKKNDHAADSLRYLVASRPQSEDQSVPEKSIPEGATVAISSQNPLVDKALSSGPKKYAHVDYTLGGEF